VHRVAQLVAHVRARVDPAETDVAHRILPTRAFAVFEAMPVADRRHALDVVGRLLAAGHDEPDLLAAALLHDVAKGDRMRLWHRVTGVLLEALAPSLLRRLASRDPASWRHPFHLYLHHGPMSAELAVRAGCGSRVAAFIRGDATGEDAPLQAALRVADDAS
jgi:hypothetical protein